MCKALAVLMDNHLIFFVRVKFKFDLIHGTIHAWMYFHHPQQSVAIHNEFRISSLICIR